MDILGYQGQNDDHEGGFRCHIYEKRKVNCDSKSGAIQGDNFLSR